MKFKVIEGKKTEFERELNAFVSDEYLVIIDIKYSTSSPSTSVYHSALIQYDEVSEW